MLNYIHFDALEIMQRMCITKIQYKEQYSYFLSSKQQIKKKLINYQAWNILEKKANKEFPDMKWCIKTYWDLFVLYIKKECWALLIEVSFLWRNLFWKLK